MSRVQRLKRTLSSPVRFVLWNFFSRNQRFIAYTRYHYLKNRIKYHQVAKPFRPIWIDPSSIEFINRAIDYHKGIGQISSGDWDTRENCGLLMDHPLGIGLYERFVEGREWEDTAYFANAKRDIQNKGEIWGYSSIQDFKQVRCAFVDELYEEIRKNGYQPNFQSEHIAPDQDYRYERYPDKLEPLVSISRNGEIYLSHGFHRTVIASILDIDPIPVNVLARHKRWQHRRESAQSTDEFVHVDHPDMQDIIKDSP